MWAAGMGGAVTNGRRDKKSQRQKVSELCGFDFIQ